MDFSIGAFRRKWRLEVFGSSNWARTSDLRINSPALYQLSYRGTAEIIPAFLRIFVRV